MRKIISAAVAALLALLIAGCGAGRSTLYLSDLDPKFRVLPDKLGIDVVLNDYPVVGIVNHNNFHKSTAIILTTFSITKEMVDDATSNLKKYAMDHIAKMTMDENIDSLIGDTPHDQLTVEQSAAVLRMEKERDNISSNETKYFLSTGANLGIGVLSLIRSIQEIPDLLGNGKSMITNVRSDFTYMGIPKLWAIPAATTSLNESIKRLNAVKNDAPILLEDMKVLVDAFRALS
ncbi:MAG: hypothetical protein IH825_04280 [Candidatus Marinimicrobia bacterium]|nr:hypothetical protein [Candidatus Neomarinimicrobiota bacterium]